MSESIHQQPKRQLAADTGQQNQAWMQFLARHELAEVDGVLRNDHPVFGEAARENDVIRLTEAAHVTWMHGIVLTGRVETTSELRR